jgi:hypothetical protein
MDHQPSTESKRPSTSPPTKRNKSNDPWKLLLSDLVEAHPNNIVLKYVIVPTALHTWWSVSLDSNVPLRY